MFHIHLETTTIIQYKVPADFTVLTHVKWGSFVVSAWVLLASLLMLLPLNQLFCFACCQTWLYSTVLQCYLGVHVKLKVRSQRLSSYLSLHYKLVKGNFSVPPFSRLSACMRYLADRMLEAMSHYYQLSEYKKTLRCCQWILQSHKASVLCSSS